MLVCGKRGRGRLGAPLLAGALALAGSWALAGCGGPPAPPAASAALAPDPADPGRSATPSSPSSPSGSDPSARAGAAPSPPAPTGPPGDPVAACVRELPKAVRIGQTMLVTTTGIERVRGWLAEGRIAGILVNGRLSAGTAATLRAATASDDNRYGALLAADEEGGGVQRYSQLVGSIASPQRQGWSMTADQVRRMWSRHAAALHTWGVDLVLAPVVDVGHGPGIGSRAYSRDPDVVAEYGLAAAEGIADAGLLPVLKHFPGHGRASGDSHDSLVTGPDLATLRDVDLFPYEHILEEGPEVGVLIGHTTVPGLTEDPSSQSAEVIDGLLRDELAFDGLVVSDALGMAASDQPTQGDALVGFLAAGGDLGIVGPGGSVEGRAAVAEALNDGRLTWERVDRAAARVLAAKGLDPCALADADRRAPEALAEGKPPAGPSSEPALEPDPPVVNPSTVR